MVIVAMLSEEKQTGLEIRKYLLISRITCLVEDGVAECGCTVMLEEERGTLVRWKRRMCR